MVLKAVMDKIPKKSEIRKYAILSQPINLTFLEDEIFQLFSYLYGSKVPKWNFAHILLWKKAKNIRKTPKNTLFTAPWLRTTLLNDTVYLLPETYDMHITIATWEGQQNTSRGLLRALWTFAKVLWQL